MLDLRRSLRVGISSAHFRSIPALIQVPHCFTPCVQRRSAARGGPRLTEKTGCFDRAVHRRFEFSEEGRSRLAGDKCKACFALKVLF